jgi:hypothetical protein
MPSPYQDFVRKAKERFADRQKSRASGTSGYLFTLHAQHKMQQYGLSEQRVRSVIRSPKRREEGIVPRTVAVMQPVSLKKIDGKEVWKQEIWVMFQQQKRGSGQASMLSSALPQRLQLPRLNIISTWRYPGVSPKRNPIPDEILRELEEGSILETASEI